MDVHQLELLLAVIDSPTMTRAAEKVHLSTAAVSLQLQSLARELNVELFVRSGRTLVPTPAARRLAEHARAVLAQFRKIEQEFANEPARDSRPFHFATGATTLIYRLAKPLRVLRHTYPNLDLHVSVLATEEIVAGLIDRQFDLGLVSLPVVNENLRFVQLFDEELQLVVPSTTPVRGHHIGTVELEKLDGASFLLYPRQSNMRALIEHFLDGLHLKRRVIMEAADTEAIKRLVETGFGYSMLPEWALKESGRYFHTARIAGHKLVRRQSLAMPLTAQPRALTEAVAAFLRDALNQEGK